MKTFRLPGAAYVAILAFATNFLQQYFGDSLWVPTAIAIIGGLIKMLELVGEPTPPAMPPGALGAPMPEQEKPNPVARWLLG